MGTLTVQQIKTAGPGRHGDGAHGLELRVGSDGTARSWVQRIRVRGQSRKSKDKRVVRGLGSLTEISLSRAREIARENWVLARQGTDPKHRPQPVPTFQEAADRTRQRFRLNWREATAAAWLAPLTRYALPAIGHMPVTEVSKDDVVGVLDPIWTKTPTVARTLLRAIRQTLQWSCDNDHVPTNVATDIDGRLDVQATRTVRHHPGVPADEMPSFLTRVRESRSGQTVKDAITLCILLACRPSEIRALRWAWVDLDARRIILPETETKQKRTHEIVLSDAAVEILRSRPQDGPLVFPARSGKVMSSMAFDRILKRCAPGCTLHGSARGTFSTWSHDDDKFPHAVIEASLGHIQPGNSTSRSYDHSKHMRSREALAEAWGRHCAA